MMTGKTDPGDAMRTIGMMEITTRTQQGLMDCAQFRIAPAPALHVKPALPMTAP
jgi:hypothetical protein